jgi:transposase-like protein
MKIDVLEIEMTLHTDCPSCHQSGDFLHIGSQTWPEAVARKLNLPSLIQVYRCEHCHTSLTEQQLKKENF